MYIINLHTKKLDFSDLGSTFLLIFILAIRAIDLQQHLHILA